MRQLMAVLVALTPSATVLGQGPVLLQQKFPLGQEVAYRLVATGMASIQRDAPEGVGLPAGDLQLDVSAEYTRRVEALGEGWAELAVRLQRASLKADLLAGPFQMQFTLALPEGDMRVLFNGVPAPQEEKPEDIEPLLALIRMPLLVRMDPSGRVVRLPQLDILSLMAPSLDFAAMQAGSTGFLPTEPVSVGDTWQQKQALPIALPAPDGTRQRELVIDYVLKELTKKDGRDVAHITVRGEFALGDMRGFRWPGTEDKAPPKEGEPEREPTGLEGLDAAVHGDIFFDYVEGQIVGAELTITGNVNFSGWETPDRPPGQQTQEQPEPVLTHTSLTDIELTVTVEKVG